MENIEKLEAEKQKKRQEMEVLLENLQGSMQGEQLSPEPTEPDSEEVKIKWQAVQEMQALLAEKRLLVETVLKEIKQGMESVKELQVRASKNDEDAILQIKALQEKMKERKETLEKAVKEMEEIGANMRKIQSQAHD